MEQRSDDVFQSRLRFDLQTDRGGTQWLGERQLGEAAGVGLALAAVHGGAVVPIPTIIHFGGDGGSRRVPGLHGHVVGQGRLQLLGPDQDGPNSLVRQRRFRRSAGDVAAQPARLETGQAQVAQQPGRRQAHGPVEPAPSGLSGGLDDGRSRQGSVHSRGRSVLRVGTVQRQGRKRQLGRLGQQSGLPPDLVVHPRQIRFGSDSPAQGRRFVCRQQVVDEVPDLLFEFVSTIHDSSAFRAASAARSKNTWLRGSASHRPAEPARQCVPRQSLGTRTRRASRSLPIV